MNCRFTVVRTGSKHKGNKPIRTDTVVGFAPEIPEEGKTFLLWSESLTKDEQGNPLGVRRVETSPVKKIVEFAAGSAGRSWLFETISGSVYGVEETNE